MKLSEYANSLGIHYNTAYRYFKAGKLDAFQTHTGTIIVKDDNENLTSESVAIYCRVSSSENKSNLEFQAQRLLDFCSAKGWKVEYVVKEIGSGMNDNRKKWLSLLKNKAITRIVVEHKDRFSRFGFNAYQVLLNNEGREIFVINNTSNDKEDLIADFISVITSFCARIYGQRRSKRNTEKLIRDLKVTIPEIQNHD